MAIYTTEAFEGRLGRWCQKYAQRRVLDSWLRVQRKKGLQYIYLRSVKEVHCIRIVHAGSFAPEMGVKGGPMMSPGVRRKTNARVGKRRR